MPFDKIGFGLVNCVVQAAIGSSRHMGHQDKIAADKAAVDEMSRAFEELDGYRFLIVSGEGERDKAPLLYHGQTFGGDWNDTRSKKPKIVIATDPLEGTNLCARGEGNSISIIAAAEEGGIKEIPDWYLNKLVVGEAARGKVDINEPIMENVSAVARAPDRDMQDLVVGVLDRPRHNSIIIELTKYKIRIKLIRDGDLSLGLAVALAETNIHMAVGIGGAPEGIITAVGMQCLNGEIQTTVPHPDTLTESERSKIPENLENRLIECGFDDYSKVYDQDDLAPGRKLLLVACGVTNGDILNGIRFFKNGVRAQVLTATKDGNHTGFGIYDFRSGNRSTVFRLA